VDAMGYINGYFSQDGKIAQLEATIERRNAEEVETVRAMTCRIEKAKQNTEVVLEERDKARHEVYALEQKCTELATQKYKLAERQKALEEENTKLKAEIYDLRETIRALDEAYE